MIQIKMVLVLLAITTTNAYEAELENGHYYTKYDGIDIDDLLNHPRLVDYYAACLLSTGPCPPEGSDLKRMFPEAVESNCRFCTERQIEMFLVCLRRAKVEYPHVFKQLRDLYDPTGEHLKKFKETHVEKSPIADKANVLSSGSSNEPNASSLALTNVLNTSNNVFPFKET